ncbi:MAG: OmpA family protein [Alphaproteobacteria bacterium]|nr:OmpA family protein [Alphaproteobacteria bacterium]
MSFRHLSNTSGLLIVLGFVLGASIQTHPALAATPSVQIFTDQAVPMSAPPGQEADEGPLSAGSLTMEDILKAHKKPERRPASPLPPATGLMMSQGMDSVFQKYNIPATQPPAAKPAQPAPEANVAEAPAQETPAKAATAEPAVSFEAGQAPKSLDAPAGDSQAKPQPEPVAASCDQNARSWEKSCADAGYPASFVGKIVGETKTSCEDGSLHDAWISNTCAPPSEEPVSAIKTAANDSVKKAEEKNIVLDKGDGFLHPPAQEQPAEVQQAQASSETSSAPKASGKTYAIPVLSIKKAESASETLEPQAMESEAVSAPAPEPAPLPVAVEKPATGKPLSPVPYSTTNPEELCGEAAEILAYEAPEKNLCRVGSPSAVEGNGPWTWTCTNNAGLVSSCRTLSLGGEDMPAPETAERHSAPTSIDASRLMRQQAPQAAATMLAMPVCGAASGQPARTAPNANLCETGKASAVRGSNPWRWTCRAGKNKVSCATIKPVDGVCGSANGKAVSSQPVSNLCKKGTESSVTGTGPWTWTCTGSNNGNDASCSAPIAPKVGELPAPEAKTVAIPIPEKSFSRKRPTPSEVPEPAQVSGDKAPEAAPKLPESSSPVPPPEKKPLHPVPTLQEETSSKSGSHASKPIALDPTLSAVLFSHLSENIETSSKTTLDKLVVILKKNDGARISLTAYADGAGLSPREVHRLSLARALAIRSYLSSKGISESRIDIQAEGASAPTGYPDRVDVKTN